MFHRRAREIHDTIRRVNGAFDVIARGVAAIHEQEPTWHIACRTTVRKPTIGTFVLR